MSGKREQTGELRQRIERHIEAIGEFTATPGEGTTRLTFSEQDRQARDYIKRVMTEYGLHVREDGFGNIFGRLEGAIEGAPAVLVGSHFDSVPNGGSYDGPAGVVAGLEVARLFRENGLKPKYPLEAVAMIEEEGGRFIGGLLGSRAMLGIVSAEEFAATKDKDGIATVEAMRAIGLDPALPGKREAADIKAFLELHIEQGPILEEEGIPIGIVEAIVGLTQIQVTVKGRAGHAGTTPMDRRADALAAASKIVAKLPELAEEQGNGTVATIGRLNVYPNGANVIPDKVVFTADLRAGREEDVLGILEKAEALANSAAGNGIEVEIERQLYIRPKRMSGTVIALLEAGSRERGIAYRPMNSGAGHDAMIFSDYTDVGMLFVPSRGGISHHPAEWSDAGDLARAVEILYDTARALTEAE
ncbi:Zn-dependent hydrolase [Saccharibacillus alkalitolerans]|uniref:Zn-dependent hydrolase n=1 Tax=Saccharibacillus alkalitolerans TaxID=2705290 RepID=A0ABX0F8T7_9BACL|nr:Zn-dependent hydrolase [Saccharibacillus alkalitolerans]NGZ76429.1 Zn-dependent hydrolase [Saccharibacillus alkalitolerans]